MSNTAIAINSGDMYKLAHEITFSYRDPTGNTGSKYLIIDNSLNIRLQAKYDLSTGVSSFSLTIYNLSEKKYNKITEGSVVEIKVGYNYLFGTSMVPFGGISKSHRYMQTVMIGTIIEKKPRKAAETLGDQEYIFTGVDVAQRELEIYKQYNRNFKSESGGTIDISQVVTDICLTSPLIQMGWIDHVGHNVPSYTSKKKQNGRSIIADIADEFGMYFICRLGRVYFVKDLATLNNLQQPPFINYDNALISFDTVKSEEPVSVYRARVVEDGNEKTQIIEKGQIDRTYFMYKMLGIPFVNVGSTVIFQEKEDIISNTNIKTVTSLVSGRLLRRNKEGISATIYDITMHYENRVNGFRMYGSAVQDTPDLKIIRESLSQGENGLLSEILEMINDQVGDSMPEVAEVSAAAVDIGKVHIKMGTSEFAASEEMEDKPIGETDLIYNVPQLTPFAGPSAGLMFPILPRVRVVNQPVVGFMNPHAILGQWWFNEWPKPATRANPNLDIILQNVAKNRVEVNEDGSIGMKCKGMKIKIDPILQNAVVDMSGSDGKFIVEIGGTATLEFDPITNKWKFDSALGILLEDMCPLNHVHTSAAPGSPTTTPMRLPAIPITTSNVQGKGVP